MSEDSRKHSVIKPGPLPIDKEAGHPICPPPLEIDVIKVNKVFNECMHTQVEEVTIDVDKSVCKNTTQAQEAECLSVTANNINHQVLNGDVVRVTFDLDVCTSIPLDTGGFQRICKTIEVSKTLRVDRAGEEGLGVQCHVFPKCLFCFISKKEQCNCIFDSFIEEAFRNLPDNEIKRAYTELYYKYSPLVSEIIKDRSELTLKGYKLIKKYTPAIQYSINSNFGHDIQIDKNDIEKIVSFIQELNDEIKKAKLDNKPKGIELIDLLKQLTDQLNTFCGQNFAYLLQNSINFIQKKNSIEKDSLPSIKYIKPIGVKEVTCCVGILILLKVEAEVQLLIPTFGYPPPPPECGEFLGNCSTEYRPDWPPYPPPGPIRGGTDKKIKGCK